MTFDEFVTLSMPLSHLVTSIFPYILGIGYGAGFIPPYIGTVHDAHIYMGLLPLILAVIGVLGQSYPKSFRSFWLIVLVVSFLLVFGQTTPLAWITYQIPIYNKFRIMTRHSMELSFSVSILAGLGVSIIERKEYDLKSLKKLFQRSTTLMMIMLLWAVIIVLYFLKNQDVDNTFHKIQLFLGVGVLPPLGFFILGWFSIHYYAKTQSLFNIAALLIRH